MKIIFLDIDGVLNSVIYDRSKSDSVGMAVGDFRTPAGETFNLLQRIKCPCTRRHTHCRAICVTTIGPWVFINQPVIKTLAVSCIWI